MGRLQDKVILITGGGSGIGRATAIMAAAEGAKVVIGNRNAERGEAVVAEIEAAGGQASFLKTDVTQEADLEALVKLAVDTYGGLHGAFNNAGVEQDFTPLGDTTTEAYRFVMDINVLGVLLSMKHQGPAMIASGGGAIVNNASVAGMIGMGTIPVYIASKHAVLGLTKSAALEWGAQGVRVNAVSPGAIETPMVERFRGESAEQQAQVDEMMKTNHPIGRIGQPDEIASAVVYLLSDESSFVLGANLPIDGGFTAQ
ncbi:MAG: glucose 1-dehydrogenase [Planctomycetota bacterium]